LSVCEFSTPEDAVTPPLLRSLLMGRRLPPDHMKIWIGLQEGKSWRNAYSRRASAIVLGDDSGPFPLPPSDLTQNIQSQTLGIGRLFIQSISTTLRGLDFYSPKLPDNPFRQLWPYERNIIWPPGRSITDPQIKIIAGGLERFIASLPPNPRRPL